MLGQANISPTEDGAEVMCCLGTILREQGDLAGALVTLSQKMASEYLPSVDTRVSLASVISAVGSAAKCYLLGTSILSTAGHQIPVEEIHRLFWIISAT